ncbi:MAG: hypothetical protein ACYS47_03805 [Planctomycetota bacterium]|jgi:Arc/MetJ-type ribon-helix-helix transcriptional regulator
MTEEKKPFKWVNVKEIMKTVQSKLRKAGVDLDMEGMMASCSSDECSPRVKVVCVDPELKDSVEKMGSSPRDRVVMVRVDEDTDKALDAWVETGAVKSRSEAAALFIREGLKVRQAELDKLRDALVDVEKAKDRLKERAKEVFGETE